MEWKKWNKCSQTANGNKQCNQKCNNGQFMVKLENVINGINENVINHVQNIINMNEMSTVLNDVINKYLIQ